MGMNGDIICNILFNLLINSFLFQRKSRSSRARSAATSPAGSTMVSSPAKAAKASSEGRRAASSTIR